MPKGIPKNKKVKVEASNESQTEEYVMAPGFAVAAEPVVGEVNIPSESATLAHQGETEVHGGQVIPLRKEGIVIR